MHCWKNTRSRKLGIWKHWEIPSAGKLIWIRVLGIRWKMKRSKKKKRKAEWNAETNCQHWHRGHSDFAKWWSKLEKSHSLAGSVNSWKKLVTAKHVQKHRPNRTRSGSVSHCTEESLNGIEKLNRTYLVSHLQRSFAYVYIDIKLGYWLHVEDSSSSFGVGHWTSRTVYEEMEIKLRA